MTTLLPKTGFRFPLEEQPLARLPEAVEPPVNLVQAVQHAVLNWSDERLRPVMPRQAGPAYYPRTLLALITYAYAMGTYGSLALEKLLRTDLQFLRLFENEYPSADMLRRFRRQNREAVQHCLVQALRFLWGNHVQSNHRKMNDQELHDEARSRIERAVLLDTIDLELDV